MKNRRYLVEEYGSFVKIKDNEYKITDEFRVQLEEFIKDKIVK